MQAQRKLIDQFVAPPADGEGPVEGWAPRPGESTSQSSPAHLLLLELSARLHQPLTAEPTTIAGPTMAMATSGKWPMPLRLMTIVGLSALCWTAICIAVLEII